MMTRFLSIVMLFAVTTFGALSPSLAQQAVKSIPVTSSDYQDIYYLEHLPADYAASTTEYPVLIFLHGAGEQGPPGGAEIDKVKTNGPPRLIEAGDDMTFTVDDTDYSFIVISPQLQEGVANDWPEVYINEVVQHVLNTYRVDRSRVYLTGLSMGGGPQWAYAAQYPGVISAIAPVAAGLPYDAEAAQGIADDQVAVWAFHGEEDPIIPVAIPRAWQNGITDAGANPAPRLTAYENLGHNCWDRAYTADNSVQEPNLYEWFLQQQRGNRPDAANQRPVAIVGDDLSITLPADPIVLDGSASQDPDGQAITYQWIQASGPTEATLAGQDTEVVTITDLSEGTHVFELLVVDPLGASSTAQVEITVTAPTPSVAVWVEAECGVTGSVWETVEDSLNIEMASADYYLRSRGRDPNSDDPNNDNPARQLQITFETPQAGDYYVVARHSLPAFPGGSFIYRVNGGEWQETQVPQSKSLVWEEIQDTPIPLNAGQNVITFVNQQTFSLFDKLVIRSDRGLPVGVGDVSVDTNCSTTDPTENQPPVAQAGADTTVQTNVGQLLLSGAASADPDGSITAYAWTQVSGPSDATLSGTDTTELVVTDLQEGVYVFELQVTDDQEASASDQVEVTVVPSPPGANQPPVAQAGADTTVQLPVDQLLLDGSGSTDPDDGIATYAWTQESGPSEATLVGQDSSVLTVSILDEGTYVFELQVTDQAGASTMDQVEVTVTPSVITSVTEESPMDRPLIVYPNPAQGQLTIRLGDRAIRQSGALHLTNVLGKVVRKWSLPLSQNDALLRVDLQTMPSGMYLLQLRGKQPYTTKVFVER